MRRRIDLSGRRFGLLTAIGPLDTRGCHIYWECVCDCGNRREVSGSALRDGKTRSCGCNRITFITAAVTKHGYSSVGSKEVYNIWLGMIARCNNKLHGGYYKYGARGIAVCRRWLDSFEDFRNDMGARPSPNYSVERKNNDGNYEPSNCKWGTRKEQQRNRRTTRKYEYRGETISVAEAIEKYQPNINPTVIYKRLQRNWPFSIALETPPGGPKLRLRHILG